MRPIFMKNDARPSVVWSCCDLKSSRISAPNAVFASGAVRLMPLLGKRKRLPLSRKKNASNA
jgi:hypothetical protein